MAKDICARLECAADTSTNVCIATSPDPNASVGGSVNVCEDMGVTVSASAVPSFGVGPELRTA